MYIHWDLKMLPLYSDELPCENSVSSSISTDLLSPVWMMGGKPNTWKEGTNRIENLPSGQCLDQPFLAIKAK